MWNRCWLAMRRSKLHGVGQMARCCSFWSNPRDELKSKGGITTVTSQSKRDRATREEEREGLRRRKGLFKANTLNEVDSEGNHATQA